MPRISAIVALVASLTGIGSMTSAALADPRVSEATVCGTLVKASIDEGNTPKEYQSYLGVWAGDWSNGRICSGLVIKKIDSNGDAFVDYVYRPAKASTTTSQSTIAHVENRATLTFNDKDGSRYTFTLRPGGELSASFLNTGGTRLETSFRKPAAIVAATQEQQTPKESVSKPGARPDASDCFMGECFKEFIVNKHYEGQTTIAEVRIERYNVEPADTKSPLPPPKIQRYVAACGSPGYIQAPGGGRLKEPEPDPPHSTRADKQLWEAICGGGTAAMPPQSASPTPAPPAAQAPQNTSSRRGPGAQELCDFSVNARRANVEKAGHATQEQNNALRWEAAQAELAAIQRQNLQRFRAFFDDKGQFAFNGYTVRVTEVRRLGNGFSLDTRIPCAMQIDVDAPFFGKGIQSDTPHTDLERFKDVLGRLNPGDLIVISGTAFYPNNVDIRFEPNHYISLVVRLDELRKQ